VFRPKGYSIVRGIWHCPRDLALSEGFGIVRGIWHILLSSGWINCKHSEVYTMNYMIYENLSSLTPAQTFTTGHLVHASCAAILRCW
jgi:hypothetical protein